MKNESVCANGKEAWELWRQDDNGNSFLVGRYDRKSAAESKLAEISRVLHKQTYWISAVKR